MTQIDSLGLEFSLKQFIEKELDLPTTLISSEIETPKEFPQCYLRNVPSTHTVIAKGRETVESVYHFEVLLFTQSKVESNNYRQKIMRLLMFNKFNYYSSGGEITNLLLEVEDDIFESPVFLNVIENTSSYYQVGYDFSVVVTFHKNYN